MTSFTSKIAENISAQLREARGENGSSNAAAVNNGNLREQIEKITLPDGRVPKFSRGKSVFSTVEPMTFEQFVQMAQAQQLQQWCDDIQLLDNEYPNHGDDYNQERAKIKKNVFIFTPLCLCQGIRTDENAWFNDEAFLDIDKFVGDIRAFLTEKLTPDFCSEHGVWFATLSIGGDGGHIHFHLRKGETPAAGMRRIAEGLGLETFDTSVKNVSRACYMTPENYWVIKPKEQDFYFSDIDTAVKTIESARNTLNIKPVAPAKKAAVGTAKTEKYDYKNIVKCLIDTIGGEPQQGDRHNCYGTLIGYVRSICDNNPDKIYDILPSFDLPEEERMRQCNDICKNYPYDGSIARITRAAIKSAKRLAQEEKFEKSENLGVPSGLPEIFNLILKYQPKQYHQNTILCALPALGVLLHGCDYLNFSNYRRHFGFGTCLIGPPASGKSFYKKFTELLLTPVRERDEIAKKQMDEYKKEMRKKRNEKNLKDNPEQYLSIILPDITLAKLAEYLGYANGDSMYMESDELDELTRVEGSKIGTKKIVFRRCFDGSVWGQDRVGIDSISAYGDCKINTMFAGTPASRVRFIDRTEIEDGLSSRWIFALMPPVNIYEVPRFEDFSDKDRRRIIELADELYNRKGTFYAPFIREAVHQWQIDMLETFSDQNEYYSQYIIRAAEIAERAAYLFAILDGSAFTSPKSKSKNNQKEKNAVQFALWIAKMTFCNAMKLFAGDLDKLSSSSVTCSYAGKYGPKQLYNDLPTVFTKEDIEDLRDEHNYTAELSTILCRWRKPESKLRIIDNNDGTFTKVKAS